MKTFPEKLHDFFAGKNVLILGFGREGRSTLSLLKKSGCNITIADRNDVSCLETDGIEVIYGENYLDCLDRFDIIMKAPGVVLLDKVSDSVKAKITSQTDLLLRFCENTVIGITGTKGKSTTSSLIYHILRSCGKDALLIGNIGVPPLDCIPDLAPNTVIVCEMSCHQLEYVQASPDIAVYLNLFEEHLDHYTGFDAYRAAKENIYRYQKKQDRLIINKSLVCAEIPSSVITASLDERADIFLDGDTVYICGEPYSFRTKLLGRHNLYNIGNHHPENLMDFVYTLGDCLKKEGLLSEDFDMDAHMELVEMQPGDVAVTYADTAPLRSDYGFQPNTSLKDGLSSFAKWYKDHYVK